MAVTPNLTASQRQTGTPWESQNLTHSSRNGISPTSSPVEMLRNLMQSQPALPLSRCVTAMGLAAKTNAQLINLYSDLRIEMEAQRAQSPDSPHKIYAIATEVKDWIIRTAAASPAAARELRQHAARDGQAQLAREIYKTETRSTPFKSLMAPFRNIADSTRPADAPPRVLHATVEYTKAKVGGAGVVAESLSAGQNRAGLTARVVTPFYGCYKSDPSFAEAEFIGFVEHDYASCTAKSAIYKIKSQGGAVTQYLVKPDPRFSALFDVETPNDIYENLPQSKKWDRNFYLTSVTAAMAANYEGKSGTKAYDILHIQDWHMGLAARLLKEKYNPEREQQGGDRVGVVLHSHGGTFNDDTNMSGKAYGKLGLKPLREQYPSTASNEGSGEMRIQRDGALFADDVIQVSDYYAKLAVEKSKIFETRQQRNALHGVLNGITHRNHDITSSDTYRDLAIDPDSTVSATPFLDGKKRAKEVLFQENVIPCADKPLYIFVGRYTSEKGIDMLPAMAEQAMREGGQVVIMGIKMGAYTPRCLKKLQRLQQKYPDSIRVYTDINDQKALLGDTGVAKGLVIRQAADFALIPSNRESCGLVGLEALAAGSIAVSSKVQGLGDFLVDHPKAGFNAFTYDNGPVPGGSRVLSFIKEIIWNMIRRPRAKKAIRSAAAYYRNTQPADREQAIRRIWESSRAYDWNAQNGSIDRITAIYKGIRNREIRPLEDADLQNVLPKTTCWRRALNAIRHVSIKNLLRRARPQPTGN